MSNVSQPLSAKTALVSGSRSIGATIAKTVETSGSIDILVNNAGIADGGFTA